MTSALSNRSAAAWKPLALVSALATITFPAIAQTAPDQQLAPVTVSASRFPNDPSFAPISATVITADQIREAGIGNVNEAIRKIGGVYGRQNLNGTSDYQLDLRGFGATSDQNMVVLVDGIRISENEQATALMSSIPIESIERIEIVRGGSSVLYGDGATGGTIQIITKRGARAGTHGTVVMEVGNQNSRELRTSLSRGWDGFSIDANIDDLRTDNYRANNTLKQQNFSGGMQWASAEGRIGMRVEVANQDSRLAGGLTLAQFLQNPQQTNTPFDSGSTDTDRYTLFAERNLGNWQLAADLSYRDKTLNSAYVSSSSQSIYDGRMTQFSPRARYLTDANGIRNELVTGMDFGTSARLNSGTFGAGDGSQQSQAVYVHDEIRIGDARVAAGVRHESFYKDASGTQGIYDQSFSVNAWDLQGSYNLTPLLNAFAKVGHSYRVPNIDDDSFTVSGAPLNPQLSHDSELGIAAGNDAHKVTAKLFRHELTNEIYYDPTANGGFGANVNLDPTKHQGAEIEAHTKLTADYSLSAVWQHVLATFTDGPNAGKELTLIPENTATLRLNWQPGNGQSADVGVQWAASQRYGSDFSNSCSARIPSYATLDARYAIQMGAWEFAVSGANLTNRDYFSQAFLTCNTDTSKGVYPDPGRVVKLSARKNF